jgi:hypothetical protein
MSNSSPPSTERVALLTDQTRRRICSILTDPDPPVSERDLAVEVAMRSLDKPAAEITADERRRYLVQLHHHQLPKLADYGLITYDRSTRTVSITAMGCTTLEATLETRPKLSVSS